MDRSRIETHVKALLGRKAVRALSDQELYDSLTTQLAAYVWAERDD
jgi:hypothetical protein